MLTKRWTPVSGACWIALLPIALAGCKQDSGGETDDIMHPNPLGDKMEQPAIVWPKQFQTDDVVVNEFIRKALDTCQKGDYDKFRQLFGVATDPPQEPQFERVWKGVKQIRIANLYVYQRPQQSPDYYVHIIVQLRQPDRYNRTERQAVIWVFKEGDEWHLAPAPNEIQGRILHPATQPATRPGNGESTTTRPSHRRLTSRPVATATAPAE